MSVHKKKQLQHTRRNKISLFKSNYMLQTYICDKMNIFLYAEINTFRCSKLLADVYTFQEKLN